MCDNENLYDAPGRSAGQPHPNMMPSLALSFCICLRGVFPSRQ
jgi:microcystin-dependent protein